MWLLLPAPWSPTALGGDAPQRASGAAVRLLSCWGHELASELAGPEPWGRPGESRESLRPRGTHFSLQTPRVRRLMSIRLNVEGFNLQQ